MDGLRRQTKHAVQPQEHCVLRLRCNDDQRIVNAGAGALMTMQDKRHPGASQFCCRIRSACSRSEPDARVHRGRRAKHRRYTCTLYAHEATQVHLKVSCLPLRQVQRQAVAQPPPRCLSLQTDGYASQTQAQSRSASTDIVRSLSRRPGAKHTVLHEPSPTRAAGKWPLRRRCTACA